jgi:rfaE bifunctional protein nucleotidyltransferase chain/domain
MSRVLRPAAAARLLRRLRRRRPRPRVVLANGLFDLLHVGHLRYLRAARRLGDFLIVAVNDDRSARRLRGPGRPIVTAADRARLVAGVDGVDAVVLFGTRTVAPLLLRLRPEVQCKGTDYTEATVPEREVVRSYGATVRIAGDPKRHASTDLIETIGRRARVRRRRGPAG